jgi:acetyl esterase/lipase
LQARGRWFEPHPRPQLSTVRVPLLAGQSGQGEVDIVEAVGCAAVSVEWRRPPEHRFPAPMDDCYAGLKWAHANAAEFGLDPGRIAVGGASSGGGSAAGLALLARDRGEVPVCFQLPVYPVLDDRNVTPASRAVTEPKVWNRQPNLIGWQSYVGGAVGTDQVSPYAAPTRADSLAGHLYPGGIHGFDLLAPASRLAQRFVRDRDEAPRRASGQ